MPDCFIPKNPAYVGYYSPKRFRNLKDHAVPTENLFWKNSTSRQGQQGTALIDSTNNNNAAASSQQIHNSK